MFDTLAVFQPPMFSLYLDNDENICEQTTAPSRCISHGRGLQQCGRGDRVPRNPRAVCAEPCQLRAHTQQTRRKCPMLRAPANGKRARDASAIGKERTAAMLETLAVFQLATPAVLTNGHAVPEG